MTTWFLGLYCFQSTGTFIISFDLLNDSYPLQLENWGPGGHVTHSNLHGSLVTELTVEPTSCTFLTEFSPLFLSVPNLQHSNWFIAIHSLLMNTACWRTSVYEGFPGCWAALNTGHERCYLPSKPDPGCERFTTLTGAHQVIINHCNSAAFVFLTLLWSVMPLLTLDLEWKEKNISLLKSMVTL